MPATPRDLTLTPADMGAGGSIEAFGEDYAIYWGGAVQDIPEPEYILDEWIPKGDLVAVAAHGNAGKSILSKAWAECIARGVPWAGRDVVQPGKVLYFTQEGVGALQHRLKAWMLHRGYDTWTEDLGIVPGSMSLGATAAGRYNETAFGSDWDLWVQFIRDQRPVAVILDPWADYFHPGAENNNDDVRAWAKRARKDLINPDPDLDWPGTTLIVPAHTSWTNKEGGSPRGASALYDAAGRVYTITPLFETEDKVGGHYVTGNLLGGVLSCEKSKDGRRPSPWYFKVVEVEVEGALGGTSVTVDGISREDFGALEKGVQMARTAAVQTSNTYDAITEIVSDAGGEISMAKAREVFGNMEGVSASSFDNTVRRMVSSNELVRYKDNGRIMLRLNDDEVGDDPDEL